MREKKSLQEWIMTAPSAELKKERQRIERSVNHDGSSPFMLSTMESIDAELQSRRIQDTLGDQ